MGIGLKSLSGQALRIWLSEIKSLKGTEKIAFLWLLMCYMVCGMLLKSNHIVDFRWSF